MLWLGYQRVRGTHGQTNDDRTKDVVPQIASMLPELFTIIKVLVLKAFDK